MAPATLVKARLLPKKSAFWTSIAGIAQASRLTVSPFFALRILPSDVYTVPLLLPISLEKPRGILDGCYVNLWSTAAPILDERNITIHPSLNDQQRPLYVLTFPRLFQKPTQDIQVPFSPYRLEENSSSVLTKAADADSQLVESRARFPKLSVDGNHSPLDQYRGWKTWNGRREPERGGWHEADSYELLQFDPSEVDIKRFSPILDELLIFEQLCHDYGWKGITSTLSWLQRVRENPKFITNTKPVLAKSEVHPFQQILPPDDLNEEAITLKNMIDPNEWEPEPGTVLPAKDSFSRFETSDPEFETAPKWVKPEAPSNDLKVIVFDAFGTIWDYQQALITAIRTLDLSQYGEKSVLKQLINNLGMLGLGSRTTSDTSSSIEEEYRIAFLALLKRYGVVQPDGKRLSKAIEKSLKPPFFPDVFSLIKTFKSEGFEVLILDGFESDAASQSLQALLLTKGIDFVSRSSLSGESREPPFSPYSDTLCSQIIDRSRIITQCKDLESSQILIVTTGLWRTIEPCNTVKIPTVLLRRSGYFESNSSAARVSPSLICDSLQEMMEDLRAQRFDIPKEEPKSHLSYQPFRIGHYEQLEYLSTGGNGSIAFARSLLTNDEVVVKHEDEDEDYPGPSVVEYETQVYRYLQQSLVSTSPCVRMRWGGQAGRRQLPVMVLDRLGPTLEEVRLVCRGRLSFKTVCMLALRMLDMVEIVHSLGIVIRDIKPNNFAFGMNEHANTLYLFDMGGAKPCIDPTTGVHIPFREGKGRIGTAVFAGPNYFLDYQQSRRDDLDCLGNTLLWLFYGTLPGIETLAPDRNTKLKRMGEIRSGQQFQDFLLRKECPPEFKSYFDHVRGLAFESTPDYSFLRSLFKRRMDQEGWENDGKFDWVFPGGVEGGTLLEDEYQMDKRFVTIGVQEVAQLG